MNLTGPLTEQIGGKEYSLPELNTYDKYKLLLEYRKREKQQLLEDLALAKADRQEQADALNEYNKQPTVDWVEYVNEGGGQFAVLRLSLEKGLKAGGVPEKEAADQARKLVEEQLDWPSDKLHDVVMKLGDLRPASRPPQSEEGPAPDPADVPPPGTDLRVYGDEGGEPAADPTQNLVYGTP